MLVDFTGRTGEIIRNNYKYFIIPLGFLFLFWSGFVILSIYESPVAFEHKRTAVIYSAEETEKTLKELTEKGYTKNLGPYYEEVRARILARQLGIMKYRLKANDNLWTLAKYYNINIDSIVGANSHLKSLTKLRLNQEIIIISAKGVLHRTKEKETVKSIALLYGVTEGKLQDGNDLSRGIKEGDYIFVPGAEPADMTEEMKAQYALTKFFGSPILKGISGARKYTSPMRIRRDPFTGEKSFHDGLDIKAFAGDKICAVASGTVVFSGENGGFGFMVKIKHDNGYTTLYGHNSKLYVVYGQKVKKGQIIAQAGSTGRSTGIHLHFTVWDKAGKLVDPALMLFRTR
ncbi:MAG: LysM peptidoglycan-binding domain-containing M23 family metallopeptidase [Candidatus Firestonebacteria bacterium]